MNYFPFLLDQKGEKKSSSLEALLFEHHSKKQAVALGSSLRFLFAMLASERVFFKTSKPLNL